MENKAAKDFLQTQQIEDCELQVGNVVLLSYPPQVPVKKLSQLLTDFASQQKPEIAWLSEDEIKDIAVGECNSENFDGFVEGGLRIQSELKTRIQPSDLQKEVERLKEYYKELAVRTNLIYPSNETEIEWFNQGTDHSKSDFFTRFNKIIEALNK